MWQLLVKPLIKKSLCLFSKSTNVEHLIGLWAKTAPYTGVLFKLDSFYWREVVEECVLYFSRNGKTGRKRDTNEHQIHCVQLDALACFWDGCSCWLPSQDSRLQVGAGTFFPGSPTKGTLSSNHIFNRVQNQLRDSSTQPNPCHSPHPCSYQSVAYLRSCHLSSLNSRGQPGVFPEIRQPVLATFSF